MQFLQSVADWLCSRILRQPPKQPVFWTLESVYLARAYYVAAELGIADILHAGGPATVEALARQSGCHPPSLHRILRALAGFGVFAEGPDGSFRMTREANPLRKDSGSSVRGWTLYVGRSETWDVFGQALESVRQGKDGFELAHGCSKYEYGVRHPEFGRAFIAGMNTWTRWHATVLADAYDFSKARKVADIAGGQGRLVMEILRANPHVHGILFDQPATVDHARPHFLAVNLSERCELVGGSFFDPLPAGADIYLLKHILRDWDDARSLQILGRIREAMPAGGKLLVIDGIVDPSNGTDRLQKLLDLEQMFWLTGRMRTLAEWKALLAQGGFRIAATRVTDVVDATILECVPES